MAEIQGARSGSTPSPLIAGALGLLLPGAGHFLLGKRRRAIIFFSACILLAVVGALIGGEMHSFLRPNAGEGFLQLLAAIGNIALGGVHLVFLLFNIAQGDITARSYEYGTTFIIIAALLNILIVLDAYDIARGEKA